MSAGVEPETNCFLYHVCQCLSLNCFILVYKRSWNLCSVLFQFVFRNVSQANGILIFQYLRKNVMYAINGLKSFLQSHYLTHVCLIISQFGAYAFT